jgi:hypothetical protein
VDKSSVMAAIQMLGKRTLLRVRGFNPTRTQMSGTYRVLPVA